MERNQSLERIKQMTKKLPKLGSLKNALSFKLRRRCANLEEEQKQKQKQRGRRRSGKFVPRDVCEGHLAVYATKDGRRPRRFVIPVDYLNHPAFKDLLLMAEDEFGFDYHTGVLTIPCDPLQMEEIISNMNDSDGGAAQCDLLSTQRSSFRSTVKSNFSVGKTVTVH